VKTLDAVIYQFGIMDKLTYIADVLTEVLKVVLNANSMQDCFTIAGYNPGTLTALRRINQARLDKLKSMESTPGHPLKKRPYLCWKSMS
jgi:hypothetical protein